ncbi:MAG TPA: FecR family protein [Nitrospiraceae bacterium]|jgi:ferric-dicitrate binding protein FerR (iron transport regulator)|nr:FecR family protein [Nitrospiraceae bacterium]
MKTLFILSTSLISAIIGMTSIASAANAPVGWAVNAIGTLTIVRTDGVQEQLQGRKTMPLFEGDVLKTDAGSQAYIQLKQGVNVALNEETTFKILSRWQKDKPTTWILRLSQGEVWAKTAGDGPKLFEIETPVATAAVKETEFNLKVQPDGQSILTVIEGIVQFGTAFGTCPIRTDTISYGVRGKKCTKPAPSDAKAAKAWTQTLVPPTPPVQ